MPLLELRESGLYCPLGDFYIDPWGPVDRAVITHGHPEHAFPGSRSYLTAHAGEAILRTRVGADPCIQAAAYGESLTLGNVRVSLHPAGHILGSAQIRIESHGEVWVVSGDYQLRPDPTCAPFEPLRCHTFVTESTFGLPIFRWPADPFGPINAWWHANQQSGKVSLLFAHPIGQAQSLLAGIDSSIGPIHSHEMVEEINQIYRAQGVVIPPTTVPVTSHSLVLAPPSAQGSPWARALRNVSTAMASGWMRIRGTRRRRSLDRGFAVSNHADWPDLLRAIEHTGADTVGVTHHHRAPLFRWLEEHGRRAFPINAPFDEVEL